MFRRPPRPLMSAGLATMSLGGGRDGAAWPDEGWFPVRLVTRGGDNLYTAGYEVWLDPDRDTVEAEDRRVITADQPGAFLGGDPEPALPALALARLGPGVGGAVWELLPLDTAEGGSASSGGRCVKRFPRRSTDCLAVTVTDWQGLCEGTDQSLIAEWVGAAYPGGYWEGVDPVTTPIGDGTLTITPDADGDPLAEITVASGSGAGTFVGTYVGCSGDWLEWVFGDETLCPGTARGPCAQHRFTVRAKCGPCVPLTPYDPGICDCTECPDGASASFTFSLSGGDTDFAGANGDYTITNGGGGCTWTGTQGSWTATLTVASGQGILVVTDGVASVSYKTSPFVCCGPWTPNQFASTGTGTTPTNPTLAGVGNCGPCQPVATDCCVDDVPAVLYVTFGGSLAAYGTMALVYNSGAARWETAAFDSCHASETTFWMECDGVNWDYGFDFAGTTYPPGVGGFGGGTLSGVTCPPDPFDGSGSSTNISTACNGGATATTFTVAVTETPP